MPRYSVKDPTTGRTVVLTGDRPPTEDDLIEIFAAIQKPDFSGVQGGSSSRGVSEAEQLLDKMVAQRDAIKNLGTGLVDHLPAVGGTVGGIVGGIGGTAFGMGVGGVPGAVGGATLGGAAGAAAKQLMGRARGTGAPASMKDATKDIGVEGAIQGATELGGGLVGKHVVIPAAKAVMRGYLKPSLAGAKIDKAREIVQTALDEALPVTKAGHELAGRVINEINQEVDGLLANVKGKVDLHQVAQKVRAFAKSKYYKPGVDNSDFDAAMQVADTLDNHPSLGLPPGVKPTAVKVSAVRANETKQAVRPNSRAYGQQGAAPEAATRKVAGSEMRQAVEDVATREGVENIGALNAREGRLIDAQDAVKHAAGREENRNAIFGVPSLLAGGIGAGVGAQNNDPVQGLVYALGARALLSPAVMTRAAIIAAKLAKNGYSAAAAARLAIQAARSEAQKQGHHDPEAQ